MVKNERGLLYCARLWFGRLARSVLVFGFAAWPDAVVLAGSELRH